MVFNKEVSILKERIRSIRLLVVFSLPILPIKYRLLFLSSDKLIKSLRIDPPK